MTTELVTPYDSEKTISPSEIIDSLKRDTQKVECFHPRGPIFGSNIQYGAMYGTDYYHLLFELSQGPTTRILAIIQRGYHSPMQLPPLFTAACMIAYDDYGVKGIAEAISTLSLAERAEIYLKLSTSDPLNRVKLSKALVTYDRANERTYKRGFRKMPRATRKPYGDITENVVDTLMGGNRN